MADTAWEVVETVGEEEAKEETMEKEKKVKDTKGQNIGALVEGIAADVALLQRDFSEASPCPASTQMHSVTDAIKRMERRLDEIERVVANVQFHQLASHHRIHPNPPQHNLFQSLSESMTDAISFK